MTHSFILNKAYCEWPEQFITEEQLRKVGNINKGDQLFLKVQGQDELITEKNPVDLGRLGVEQIYTATKEKYQFIINQHLFVSHESFITEEELRIIGKIPPDDDLFFKKEGEDHKLTKAEKIDLKPYPIEEFYSAQCVKDVSIVVDNITYNVKPGKYSVEQIKAIGKVKPGFLLEQLVNNILVKLPADAVVVIKGGEEFKSFAKDGTSS
jgi:hypothetical protein